MPKRWSEPGWDRWLKIAIWALLLAVVVYGVVMLGSALARRFRAIRGSYQVPAASYKRLCSDGSLCAKIPPIGVAFAHYRDRRTSIE
jgi:hypothetical protein